MKNTLICLYMFTAMTIMLSGCHAINKFIGLPDDNPIEEIAEAAIKASSGQEIDLTPETPETKK